MKTFSIFFLFVFLFVNVEGQIALKKTCISSGGGSSTAGTKQVIYTVGELAVQEKTQNNVHISEGFIGSDILETLSVVNLLDIIGIHVYPNPAIDVIQIDLPNGTFDITLYDINGKSLLFKQTNNINNTQLDITNLASSSYILLVKDKINKRYKTFKVIKSNV